MQTDYYENRYPFIFHRCRWQHGIAQILDFKNYTLIPLSSKHINSLLFFLLNPSFKGFYDDFRTSSCRLRYALEGVVRRGGHFAIHSKADGTIIGEFIILEENRQWEISYWLGLPYHGRGIMAEVVKEFAEWTFQKTSLSELYAEYEVWNTASKRVLEACGFIKIGEIKGKVRMCIRKSVLQ